MNKKLLILSLVCFFGSSVYAEMLIEEGQICNLNQEVQDRLLLDLKVKFYIVCAQMHTILCVQENLMNGIYLPELIAEIYSG